MKSAGVGLGGHLLIITPFDLDRHQNNLEHHRIRHYADRGYGVTAVCKTTNVSIRPRDLIRDTLRFRVVERDDRHVRIIAVDPFMNYFGGLHRTTLASGSSGEQGERRRTTFGRNLIRALSPLALLRDVFVVPCMLATTLRRPPRSCEVCLAFGPWGAIVGLVLRKLGRIRTLVYEDRDFEPGLYPDRLRRWYVGVLERFCIRRADVVVSVSRSLSDLRWAQTRRRTHVVPSGVLPNRFANDRSPDPARARLIFVGNLFSWGGVDLAILAMRRIREAVVRLLGDTELYARQSENGVRHSGVYDWQALLQRELDIIADARERSGCGDVAAPAAVSSDNR